MPPERERRDSSQGRTPMTCLDASLAAMLLSALGGVPGLAPGRAGPRIAVLVAVVASLLGVGAALVALTRGATEQAEERM